MNNQHYTPPTSAHPGARASGNRTLRAIGRNNRIRVDVSLHAGSGRRRAAIGDVCPDRASVPSVDGQRARDCKVI